MFESQVITDWTSYSSFIFFADQAIVNNSFVDWWVLVQFTDCCKTLFTLITFKIQNSKMLIQMILISIWFYITVRAVLAFSMACFNLDGWKSKKFMPIFIRLLSHHQKWNHPKVIVVNTKMHVQMIFPVKTRLTSRSRAFVPKLFIRTHHMHTCM